MSQIVEEDEVSEIINKDEILNPEPEIDHEIDSGYSLELPIKNDLIKVQELSFEDLTIKNGFFSSMGQNSDLIKKTKIMAIHKILNSSWSLKAREKSFEIFAKAVADKCGGDANIKYGWYGGSKDEICEIVMHGFSWHIKDADNRDCYRRSISLSPAKLSFDGVLSSKVDENGLRHLLLCQVILGKQEVVTVDSNQLYPSSPDFDSGVDDLSAPRKYVIWSSYMNSHIFPCFIISFKTPYLRGLQEGDKIKPRSPWMRYPALISMLSRYLGASEMASLNEHYKNFQEKKIKRSELVQRTKEIAGNQLLSAILNMYGNKCVGLSKSAAAALEAAKGR